MNDELQELQQGIVSVVLQELSRFGEGVKSEVERLREEVAAGAAARSSLEQQVGALAAALEQSQAVNTKFQSDLQHALEDRLNEFSTANTRRHEEMTTRLGKVIDDANVGIASTVEAAARPVLKDVEVRQEQTDRNVKALGDQLQRFDEQAGKIVNHVNQVTQAIDGRLEEMSGTLSTAFDERLGGLVMRIDEVSAAAARQQAEVANIVGDRVDGAEVRINERMIALESRMNDEIGQRVADIDAHVGHISASLDDTVVTLSDRIQKANEQFAAVDARIEQLREEMKAVDAEAIDEMKEQIGSALGQAELVRIEMDRFKDEIGKGLESTNVRLTELETTVQDQTLDVETAVQLERLEEVERAVLMLDPDQFVRREDLDDLAAGATGDASPSASHLDHPSAPATAPLTPPTADPSPASAGMSPPSPA